MKNYLFVIGIIAGLFMSSCKPGAEDILKKSFEKCQSVENGYYEMKHSMKYMMGKDTTSSSYKCYFQKLADDSIYSSAFHYQYFNKNGYSKDILYTGNDFVTYSEKDSTGEIMSKSLWAKQMKSFSHNYTFYAPLSNRKSRPLPEESDFIDNRHIFQNMGETFINEIPCYHVIMNIIPENDSMSMIKNLHTEYQYWISKKDFIPVQYSISHTLLMNNDTVYQFEKFILTKYEMNISAIESHLKMTSVPSFIKLKDYVPLKRPELLPVETIAPDWILKSLDNQDISLSGLRGKVVLIDFFYKSCYPCIQALPTLQRLHEKYMDRGLQVIGMNPYDTKEDDDIENFLMKQGVKYTILLGAKEVAGQYHVSGYPTMYLIDKDQKIIFREVGYGAGMENKLEELIMEHL